MLYIVRDKVNELKMPEKSEYKYCTYELQIHHDHLNYVGKLSHNEQLKYIVS